MKRYLPTLAAILFLFCAFVLAHGTAGTASDPVITLSYLNLKFDNAVAQKAAAKWKPLADQLSKAMETKKTDVLSKMSKSSLIGSLADEYIARKGGSKATSASRFTPIALKKGEVITGGTGTGLLLRAGSAKVTGPKGTVVVNVTAGKDVAVGAAIALNQNCIVLDAGGTGFTITSDTATVAVCGTYRVTRGYASQYTDLADALYAMKLFKGSPSGYNLDRASTRLEGLVMMVRLLGEENAALAYTGDCPFTDVPDWGKPYAAYGYKKGYVKGTSTQKKLFTPNSPMTPEQYVTLVLRSLGYSDADNGDFVWDKSPAFAVKKNLFSQAEIDMLKSPFYRDQIVYLSYYALSVRLKNSDSTLLSRLVSAQAVDETAASAAMRKVTRTRP